jgi:hypothetical protein
MASIQNVCKMYDGREIMSSHLSYPKLFNEYQLNFVFEVCNKMYVVSIVWLCICLWTQYIV